MTVCARSWRDPSLTVSPWNFCTLPRGHDGNCASAGVPKPPTALFYEDDTETQAFIAKQRLDEQKMIAKKEAKRLGESPES